MRKSKLLFGFIFAMLCCVVMQTPMVHAEDWVYISADAKYAKYFDPGSVKATRSIRSRSGSHMVPAEIQGWTKTTYTVEGAAETIENYGIKAQLPDPARLSSSWALVQINPQNRTIQYIKEDFYDASGNVIWSKADGRVKEINSQEFDEEFYVRIVDTVFGQGETARSMDQNNRWITLWAAPMGTVHTSVMADTTTMRLKGENLIFWEWEETKDASGNVAEIKFMKRNVNLNNETAKIERASYWSAQTGWKNMEVDGAYRLIPKSAPNYKGLQVLRAYVESNRSWVERYSFN